MGSLLLVKLQTPADTASPEAEYSLGCLRAEAERIWETVELRSVTAVQPLPRLGDCDVLLVGTGNVLVTARSLGAMAARRRDGASVVIPFSLPELLHPAAPAPYTLRGFESYETRLLAGDRPPASPRRLLPLSLLSGEVAATLSGTLPWEGEDPALAHAQMADCLAVEAVREGLCHHFADYYAQVRDDVLRFVPSGARDVLEIGCGAGATGRLLTERLGCRVTGVELNPAAARAASAHLDRVLCGDVAKLDLEGSYDLVVALELFEHLPDAEAVLERLAKLVRPGGRVLLSVPNVGHHAVVLDLLAGRWDYLPIGILCYTHFRFFTRRTLEDWLRRLGFSRFTLVAQRTELPPELGELGTLDVDHESLAAKGFYVLIDL